MYSIRTKLETSNKTAQKMVMGNELVMGRQTSSEPIDNLIAVLERGEKSKMRNLKKIMKISPRAEEMSDTVNAFGQINRRTRNIIRKDE